MTGICSFPRCGRPERHKSGLCAGHNTQKSRWGQENLRPLRSRGQNFQRPTREFRTDQDGSKFRFVRLESGQPLVKEFQHDLVMEATLGRPLGADEAIRHRDGNKSNNHPDNLELMVVKPAVAEPEPEVLTEDLVEEFRLFLKNRHAGAPAMLELSDSR